MQVRSAEQTEIDPLAKVWYEAWHEAHSQIVPPELTALRTLESFRDRLQAALPDVRAIGPFNEPVGFCIVKGSELDQLFVSAQVRGLGVAPALITDAEAAVLRRRGSVAPSETNEPRGSTRNVDGFGPARWFPIWKRRRECFRWKFGALKSVCGRKVLPEEKLTCNEFVSNKPQRFQNSLKS